MTLKVRITPNETTPKGKYAHICCGLTFKCLVFTFKGGDIDKIPAALSGVPKSGEKGFVDKHITGQFLLNPIFKAPFYLWNTGLETLIFPYKFEFLLHSKES